jgi:ectoine hydroxylase-related dioxygenase (phytanoyl-CoA dioxygenase family)
LFARETLHPKYHLTGFHGNILAPSASPHKLHIDDNLPFELPKWGIRTSFHFVLQDNSKDSGATLYLPNSHLLNRVPTLQEVNEVSDSTLSAMEAKVGDLLMWSGRLWHKSGANNSNIDRVALLTTFVPSFLLDIALEENYYRYFDDSEVESIPEIARRFINWEQGTKY